MGSDLISSIGLAKLILVLTISQVLSCSTYPDQKSNLETDDTGIENACSSIAGQYRISSSLEESTYDQGRLDLEVYVMKYDQEYESADAEYLEIHEGPEYGFNLILKNKGEQSITERNIEYAYRCDGPWIVYESEVKYGSGGTPYIITKTVTKIKKSRDDSLVVSIDITTVSSEWLIGRETEKQENNWLFVDYCEETGSISSFPQ